MIHMHIHNMFLIFNFAQGHVENVMAQIRMSLLLQKLQTQVHYR